MTGLISIFIITFLNLHPLHVSFTNVDFNSDLQEVSVTYKFFTDDFSLLLYHVFGREIIFKNDQVLTSSDIELIDSYLSRAFLIVEQNDTLKLDFIRKEQDDQSLWFYYKAKRTKNRIRDMSITNLLMLNIYDDQTNLVIISDGRVEKGYSFNLRNRSSSVSFR
jgi:hypothetical protein